jgi:Ca2+-binding EF-hand superfamily protein
VLKAQVGKFGSPAELARLFAEMDLDKDGTLSKTELYVALTSVFGLRQMKPAHMDTLWPLLDTDNSDSLDTNEFVAFMTARETVNIQVYPIPTVAA